MNIHWLPSAIQDIESIYDFFKETNLKYAIHLYNELVQEVKVLEHFPQLGHVELSLLDLEKNFRSLVIMKGRFKVLYSVSDENIYIHAVRDCRMSPNRLINERNQNEDMEKKYNFEENSDNTLQEPAIKYGFQEEIKILPLTEEDLKGCITEEELLESVYAHIDKLFDSKK